ncbi:MAG TPA: hypothetical protein ENF94_01095 [Candidatus Woesearchaeota archaeon]|nr:hypothetical protein [Candidatus Woesearchaeota archaeon]
MEIPINLGGVIELSGFSTLDGGTMAVLKKIIGAYTRKFIDRAEGFEKVSMHLKRLKSGDEEGLGLFELHGKVLIKGKLYNSEVTERNIFFAVDSVMKKLHNSVFD